MFEKPKSHLEYVYPGIPFYRDPYDRHGVKPDDIRHLEDFTEKIPDRYQRDATGVCPPSARMGQIEVISQRRISGCGEKLVHGSGGIVSLRAEQNSTT